MNHNRLMALVIVISFCGGCQGQAQDKLAAESPKSKLTDLSYLLEPIRQKHNVPAICAAVVNSDGIIAMGAVGFRRRGDTTAVTTNDVWHLGSNTKAMTAAVFGLLVEQKKVRWTSTLAELFPELADQIHPQLRDVTVLQLLSHQAGLTENLNWRSFASRGDIHCQRQAVLEQALTEKPKYTPGTQAHYSNLGYVVAGIAVERISGKSWEDQIYDSLFKPLGMTTAGFGGVGTPGKLDQPWGHRADGSPVEGNGPDMDNAMVMAPAGCVHASISDWAKFVIDQLRGGMGKSALMTPDTYRILHTPPFGNDYALGWLAVTRDWGGGAVLHHTGSNTMNYANTWIAPKRDFAVLVCINQGGDAAFAASDETVAALIKAIADMSR
jgi:CubicO group peptidase (beta-lactamase class C family)